MSDYDSIIAQAGTFSQPQRYGAEGEAYVLAELVRFGFTAQPLSDWTDNADLLITAPTVAPVLVEVKQSRPRTVYRRNKNGWQERTIYSWDVGRLPAVDLVVVLVADTPTGRHSFWVPSWLLAGQRSVVHLATAPEAYVRRGRGWLAPFYESWRSTVAAVAAARQKRTGTGQQLSFLGTVELC